MRGQPLWQVLFIVVAFALASVPVWKLTRPAAIAVETSPGARAEKPGQESIPLEIEISFAPMPDDFQLQHLGKTILKGHGPQTKPLSVRWTADIPKEGIDLTLQANWPPMPEGSAAAARAIVRLPNSGQIEKNFWQPRGGPLAEIITVARPVEVAAPSK